MMRVLVVPLFASFLHGAEPVRVLFIGNSYTSFNNAPEIFAELTRAAIPGRQVETGMVAVPGATLAFLWEHSEARRMLRSSKWDYVVLQDQSQLGDGLRDGKFVVNSPMLFHWGVRIFDAEIRKAGARTVLLLTWSRRAEPDQQADLNYAYDSIARELGATLAPAGPAWQRARQESPGLELYAKDGSHPSPVGSYLLACVLVKTLFPDSDGNLPSQITGHALSTAGPVDSTRNVVLVALSDKEARKLQTVAKSVVAEMIHRGGYLNAHQPERPERTPPGGGPLRAEQLAGTWTGDLTYYPVRAVLDLTLLFDGDKCQGQTVVRLPERKQQYETPVVDCDVSEQDLRFSVPTLPVPFLFDRFVGRLVDDRLIGTVERRGREMTNSMSGVWNLRRQAVLKEGGR